MKQTQAFEHTSGNLGQRGLVLPPILKSEIIQSLHSLSLAQFPAIQKIRRALHRRPELSGDERYTSEFIAVELSNLGLKVNQRFGGYGILADLIVDPSKPTAALRMDMDALPIHEINDVPYRSEVNGVMHACGHDVHSAIGVGVAAVLSQLKNSLPGNIRLIFQPEEEEITGALRMIQAGAIKNPTPTAIFGLHVAPLPSGQIAYTDGLFLAGFDHFLVTLSPAAERPLGDLNRIAARCCALIKGLNQWELPNTWDEMQLFWKEMQDPASSLGQFVIYDASQDEEDPQSWPGQFALGIKAASSHLRKAAIGRVRAAVNPLCRATHTRYQIEKMGTMQDMRNNTHLVQSTLPALRAVVGESNLVHLHAAFPFNCEDFALFTKHIPGAMIWLGAADPTQHKYAILHTPNFDVDENCLVSGVEAVCALILGHLSSNPT